MKILVTGNTGLIGSSIAEELNNDAILFKTKKNPRDLMKKKDILDAVNNADAIINAAGIIPNHEKNIENFDFNYFSLKNLLKAAQIKKIPLVHLSSQAVYGKRSKSPVNEKSKLPIQELDLYAKSKFMSEKLCHAISSIPIVILRLSSVYGAKSLNRKEFLSDIVMQAKNNEILLFGKGNRIHDFVYVKDVARVAISIIGQSGIFNVGSGIPLSSSKISKIVQKKINCNIIFDKKKKESPGFWLDISRLQKKIQYHPTPLDKGLDYILI